MSSSSHDTNSNNDYEGGDDYGGGGGGIVFVKIDDEGRYWHVHDSVGREKIGGILRDRLHAQYKSSSKSKIAKRKAMKDTPTPTATDNYYSTMASSSRHGLGGTAAAGGGRGGVVGAAAASRNLSKEDPKTFIESLYRFTNTTSDQDGEDSNDRTTATCSSTQYYPTVAAIAAAAASGHGGGTRATTSSSQHRPQAQYFGIHSTSTPSTATSLFQEMANEMTAPLFDESIFDLPSASSSSAALAPQLPSNATTQGNYGGHPYHNAKNNNIFHVLNQACGIVSSKRRLLDAPTSSGDGQPAAFMVGNMSNVIGRDDEVTNLFSTSTTTTTTTEPASSAQPSARRVVPSTTRRSSTTHPPVVDEDWDAIF